MKAYFVQSDSRQNSITLFLNTKKNIQDGISIRVHHDNKERDWTERFKERGITNEFYCRSNFYIFHTCRYWNKDEINDLKNFLFINFEHSIVDMLAGSILDQKMAILVILNAFINKYKYAGELFKDYKESILNTLNQNKDDNTGKTRNSRGYIE
jgi:hypothetical protein